MKRHLLLVLSALLLGAGSMAAQTTLYLRGINGNWDANEQYAATGVDGTYTWEFNPGLKLNASSSFKVADATWSDSYNFGAESATAISFEGGQATLTLVAKGANITMPSSDVTVTKIVFTTSDNQLVITGTEGEPIDPLDYPVYIRGTVNNWLNTEISAGTVDQKWQGVTTDNGTTYVWNWSAEEGGGINLAGEFKFGNDDYTVHNYGAAAYNSPLTTAITEVQALAKTESNFTTGDVTAAVKEYADLYVKKLTLNLTEMYLYLEYVTEEPTTEEVMYISLNAEGYKVTNTTVTAASTIYAWEFDAPVQISGNVYPYMLNGELVSYYVGATSEDDAMLKVDEAGSYTVTRSAENVTDSELLIEFTVPDNSTWYLTEAALTVTTAGESTLVLTLSDQSGVEEQAAAVIYATNGTVNSEGEITIYALDGSDVTAANGGLAPGNYIVKSAEGTIKIAVP